MSEIFFTDDSEVPLPPDEVRILKLEAQPRPDGQRIFVEIEITPFQLKPNVELIIFDEQQNELAMLSVVEAIDRKMEFTMHLRGSNNAGKYELQGRIFYADIEKYGAEEGQEVKSAEILAQAKENIDLKKISFSIE